MFQSVKRLLYFPLAYYFRFFAQIKLSRWKPRVIVVTGSSGKTTLLSLIEAQLGNRAKYSHHANSSYGIPFDILGLERKTLLPIEWLELFLKAPFLTFSKVPTQKIYIVETDCDRPFEGVFLSTLLKPEVTIWLSSSRTHSMNFDYLVEQGKFKNVDEAIAYEYGFFLEATGELVIVNSDVELITKQIKRSKARVTHVSKKDLKYFKIKGEGEKFLLPDATDYSITATLSLVNYLGVPFDESFAKFSIPPGRSSILKGIKNTTIIDSSYNSNLGSATEVINIFNKIKADKKWAVIGDMLEQGKEEEEEHKKLANLICDSKYERVVLLGPRIIKHGFKTLENHYKENVMAFTSPKEVLEYLKDNIEGGETILFKGARFLEGVIENLLLNPDEAIKLARREKVWEIRREKWRL